MARRRLSEFRAKTILSAGLGLPYQGIEIDVAGKTWRSRLPKGDGRYAVKVDQAVKQRFKRGLVKLDRPARLLATDIKELATAGYRYMLVEPYLTHSPEDERYLAFRLTADGIMVTSSLRGGVDIENHADELQTARYTAGMALPELALTAEVVADLVAAFDTAQCCFLEINPLVVTTAGIAILDAAVEVDGAAAFFVQGAWSEADLRSPAGRVLSAAEQRVSDLKEQSPASFSLEVLNPDGDIFLLLSGGGASVVVADEVNNLGQGHRLANYGEYSGGPNREETMQYTAAVIELLLASSAPRKTLIIAGGVANFTDVKATFAGVIDALRQHQAELKRQQVTVYVRRGGPNEAAGLELMRDYLHSAGILGAVHGPELVLTDIVAQATGGSV